MLECYNGNRRSRVDFFIDEIADLQISCLVIGAVFIRAGSAVNVFIAADNIAGVYDNDFINNGILGRCADLAVNGNRTGAPIAYSGVIVINAAEFDRKFVPFFISVIIADSGSRFEVVVSESYGEGYFIAGFIVKLINKFFYGKIINIVFTV